MNLFSGSRPYEQGMGRSRSKRPCRLRRRSLGSGFWEIGDGSWELSGSKRGWKPLSLAGWKPAATFSGRRCGGVDRRLKSLRFLRSLAANHFAGFSAAGKSAAEAGAVQDASRGSGHIQLGQRFNASTIRFGLSLSRPTRPPFQLRCRSESGSGPGWPR